MSQEVVKRLVGRLQPQCTPLISRLQPIDPNHLQTSNGTFKSLSVCWGGSLEDLRMDMAWNHLARGEKSSAQKCFAVPRG